VIRKVAVLVAALSLLTGCGMTQEAGAAVVIGDQRLTNQQLESRFVSVMDALGDQQAPGTAIDVNRRLISSFVFAVTTTAVAKELGVGATDADIEAQYQSLLQQYGSKEALNAAAAAGATAPETIKTVLRTSANFKLIGLKLDPAGSTDTQNLKAVQALSVKALQLGLEVAPRYGNWDFTTFSLGDDTTLSMTLEQFFPDTAATPAQ
jgi:hypothetical protein